MEEDFVSHQPEQGSRFQPTWESLQGYKVPQWYIDAKFGIFIHWGIYSIPAFASEWYASNMYQQDSPEFAHYVATYAPQTEFGYKDFRLFEVECGELQRRTYLGKIGLYHQSLPQGDPTSKVYPRRPPGSIPAIRPPSPRYWT